MKYETFKRQVSDVLTEMGQVRRGMFNPNAVELICMICAHELHLQHLPYPHPEETNQNAAKV